MTRKIMLVEITPPAVTALAYQIVADIPLAKVGVPVAGQLGAKGGAGNYSFAGSSLPPGLSVSADGKVTGTPTTAGFYEYTATVTDDAFASRSQTFAISIGSAVVVKAFFPAAEQGLAYSVTLLATGGTGPYTWSTLSGTLPAGLTRTGDTISGTPTTPGTYIFTIRATDAGGKTGDYAAQMSVAAPVALAATFPAGIIGVAYSVQLAASDGVEPYAYALTAGTLNAGLTISATGVVSGVPTATESQALTFSVTDAIGGMDTLSVTIDTAAAGTDAGVGVASLNAETGALMLTSTGGTVAITTPTSTTINLEASGGGGSFPFIGGLATPVTVGSTFSFTPTTANVGVNPLFELTAGSVPTGSSAINATTGGTSGILTAAGDFVFEIACSAIDGANAGATVYSRQHLTITGSGVPPTAIANCTAWFDFTDASTMFIDNTGTLPVSADGDDVLSVTNKADSTLWLASITGSGWGKYKTAVISGNSVYRSLVSVRNNFSRAGVTLGNIISATDATCVFGFYTSGITASTGTYTDIALLSDVGQYFGLYISASPDRVSGFNWPGSGTYAVANVTQGAFNVITIQHKAGNIKIRINGGSWVSVASANTGNIGNKVIFGPYSQLTLPPGTCDIVHMSTYNVNPADADILSVEKFLGATMGITI